MGKYKFYFMVFITIMFGLTGCSFVLHSEGSSKHGSQGDTTPNLQKSEFDFREYLPFIPLLPSYTVDYSLTHSTIVRYLSHSLNENSISYSAVYSNGFVITEGRPNQLDMVQLAPKSTLMINNIHASMQKHDGGESIDFIKNDIFYDVTSTQGTVSFQNLKKICASISIPATQPPSEIHISSDSASGLSFKPIMAGQFSVPGGLTLNTQGSAINISGTSKNELFQITYKNSLSYLTVIQSNGLLGNYYKNSIFHIVKMQGTSVYYQFNDEGLPGIVFTIPQTGVQFTIWSNISSDNEMKVVNSIIRDVTH